MTAREKGVAFDGRSLSVRIIKAYEVRDLYLPLRYEILYLELGWVIGDIKGPTELYDDYDKISTSFGIFAAKAGLVAAGRLITVDKEENLPSVRLLGEKGHNHRFTPPVAELSRILVARPYRAIGLFRILLLTGVLLACRDGIRSLIITEKDDDQYADFLARHGFRRHADGFAFFDGKLDPREPAATYVFDISDECREAIKIATSIERAALVKCADADLERIHPVGARGGG
jgi:predicted GNAT family N-acyltransferase